MLVTAKITLIHLSICSLNCIFTIIQGFHTDKNDKDHNNNNGKKDDDNSNNKWKNND